MVPLMEETIKGVHIRAEGESKMIKRGPTLLSKQLVILTIGGGAAFWVTTIVTSLLPIAAEYRAAFSNWSVQTVWVASLLVGMMIGCCVSYSLLRFTAENPTKDPILTSTI